MPAALLPREEVVERLLTLFRHQGYDGSSLSEVSTATGLGRSSLYHHFPGGKEQMALAVLELSTAKLSPALEQALGEAAPKRRLEVLLGAIDAFYESGRLACVLERLCASVDRRAFARPLKQTFTALLGAFETIACDAGVKKSLARQRAEDAVVRIQGSLVLSVGVSDAGVFRRALDEIRRSMLA